ncbi:hypothetical protein CWE23_06435 [Idiomarina aquatica]|uniref:Uncharacterized protein n=1 Tax=Idiomarina aquatica TaxID=1327752 RepID=A0AA94EGV9_9GAMM|nr:hypothetical protein CWE23_06435 [Idiomarina aquatica]
MNLYFKCIKSGIWKASLLFLVFLLLAVFVALIDDRNDTSFLLDFDFYINMIKSPLIVGIYIILAIVFSVLSIMTLSKSN